MREHRRRQAGAGIVAALLGVSFLAAGAVRPAAGVASFDLQRLAGEDRFATAAAVAGATFDEAPAVVMARADQFSDALAGNYLAGAGDGPVLLAEQDDVPQATLDALVELGVAGVVLLGGPGALGVEVEEQLVALGYTVARVAGATRYDTAAAIATALGSGEVGVDGVGRRTAILSSGEAFPDALAAAPLAFGLGFPQLLTAVGGLHPAAAAALGTLGIEHVIVTGGTGAISAEVVEELEDLGVSVERFAGNDRYETAVAIATAAVDSLGFTPGHVNLASGLAFADALAGGGHGGAEGPAVTLLTAGTSVPGTVCQLLRDRTATLESGHLYGGVAAVSAVTEIILEACAGGGAAVAGFRPRLVEVADVRVEALGLATLVDFVFDAPVDGTVPASRDLDVDDCEAGLAPLVCSDALEFGLVTAIGGVIGGQSIAQVAQSGTSTVVTVRLTGDQSQAGIRRGTVVVGDSTVDTVAANAHNDPLLAGPLRGTDGSTADPDLVSAARVGDTTYRFVFDEAVSGQAGDLSAASFAVFDAGGLITRATSVSVPPESPAAVVATFPALPASGPGAPASAFVLDAAVHAAGGTPASPGAPNRAAELSLVLGG